MYAVIPPNRAHALLLCSSACGHRSRCSEQVPHAGVSWPRVSGCCGPYFGAGGLYRPCPGGHLPCPSSLDRLDRLCFSDPLLRGRDALSWPAMAATAALPDLGNLGSLCRDDAAALCNGVDSLNCRGYGAASRGRPSHSDNLCGSPCPGVPWFHLAPYRTCMDRLRHPRV